MNLAEKFDRLAQHIAIERAILEHGGRLVASFELDAEGRTVGHGSGGVRDYRCNDCGERGHNRKRCNGEGQPPKPTYHERRINERVRRLAQKADLDLASAREEIQRRIAARKR